MCLSVAAEQTPVHTGGGVTETGGPQHAVVRGEEPTQKGPQIMNGSRDLLDIRLICCFFHSALPTQVCFEKVDPTAAQLLVPLQTATQRFGFSSLAASLPSSQCPPSFINV